MKVLIACEFSGIVRDAFRARGHDAWSCDLLPSERPGRHIRGDVRLVLGDGWNLMVAFPPCTYLARSGARWRHVPGRSESEQAALAFVHELYDSPIPRVAIENPVGRLNSLWRYPDQVVEPWYFGDPYRKRTNIWLKKLPPLMASQIECGRTKWVMGMGSLASRNSTRGTGDLGDGKARSPQARSRTFPGVAAAMADQWGSVVSRA